MFGEKVDLSQHQAIKDLVNMKKSNMSQEEFKKKHSSYVGQVPSWNEKQKKR